jgi:His-Xaa-Ser system protein HxsD
MPPVVTDRSAAEERLVVDFDSSVQLLEPLQAAAYRLIGTATCQIEQIDGRLVCNLVAQPGKLKHKQLDPDSLKAHFLNLVTDENLRSRLAGRTEGLRNVIVALAFGSLVSSPDKL